MLHQTPLLGCGIFCVREQAPSRDKRLRNIPTNETAGAYDEASNNEIHDKFLLVCGYSEQLLVKRFEVPTQEFVGSLGAFRRMVDLLSTPQSTNHCIAVVSFNLALSSGVFNTPQAEIFRRQGSLCENRLPPAPKITRHLCYPQKNLTSST